MPRLMLRFVASQSHRLLLGVILLLVVGIALQACGGDDVEVSQSPPTTAFATPTPIRCFTGDSGGRESGDSPQVSKDVIQVACDNSNFAFDLYKAVSEGEEGNLFFSPFSISQVLAMAYAGARGETERQMAETLRYSLPQERLHPALGELEAALQARAENAFNPFGSEDDAPSFRLNIANAVWGQHGFGFRTEYLDALYEYYGGELRQLNFAAEPEPTRVTINNWVEEQTEGKIKDLIPEGAIGPLTRFILTNAIYFNAQWLLPFNPEATEQQPFHLLDGTIVEVPMMTTRSSKGSIGYVPGEGFQAVRIPYNAGGISMVVLLPDEGGFEEFERSLEAGILGEGRLWWRQSDVTLTMPRFGFEFGVALKKLLTRMGMPDAFDEEEADFSGITEEKPLSVSDIFHKAFVSVDEEGTEAAAATALMGIATGGGNPLQPVVVTLDRPFIFLIRDRVTGTILFLGRVMDPR